MSPMPSAFEWWGLRGGGEASPRHLIVYGRAQMGGVKALSHKATNVAAPDMRLQHMLQEEAP